MNKKSILLIFWVALNLIGCIQKRPVDYSSFAFLFQNSTSGNCAVIEKTTLNGNSVYTATGKTVASGRCVEGTFFTFPATLEAAKLASDTYYSNMALAYNKYSDCSDLTKVAIAARESVTVSSIETKAASIANGCVNVTPKTIYCKDASSLASFRSNFRYHTITNAKVDMAKSYESTIAINAGIDSALGLNYEAGVLGNLRIANATEVALFEGSDAAALQGAFPQYQACFLKVITGNSNLKTAYTKIPSLQEFFKEEITVSIRKAVTETLTFSLSCRYGTGVDAIEANGATPAVGICPTTYPQF
jgi:hypothetical protein